MLFDNPYLRNLGKGMSRFMALFELQPVFGVTSRMSPLLWTNQESDFSYREFLDLEICTYIICTIRTLRDSFVRELYFSIKTTVVH